ncbi:MAG: aldehyde dehydrogenase family protein, partial [Candidatus Marinimicrobia bacterium]|nr:aldehyde dehydrogenase family protein [Candidatus Neomarinimicrobiota bacterium]
MHNGIANVPVAVNEPIWDYRPGSSERESLMKKINELKSQVIDIPLIIGGKEVRTGHTAPCVIPHDHQHVLGNYHMAGEKEIQMAIEASQEAFKIWSEMAWESRASIFKKMAVLLQGPYRDILNASTMLAQSKTVYQAEIDSACELIDFYNFNVEFMSDIYSQQPLYNPDGMWNQLEFRAIEGFIFA